MTDKITFYDIPSKDPCRSWSPNTLKVRLALNYKNIPYETTWLEYPEIAPTLKSHGVPPNPEGSFAAYTLPAVRLSDGTFIMESTAILKHLDEIQPEPSLFLGDELQSKVQSAWGSALFALMKYHQPQVAYRLLSEGSKDWFINDRSKRGLDMSMIREDEEGWKNAQKGLNELETMLNADDGPFLRGEKPSYADFIIVGFLDWFAKLQDGSYERLVEGRTALQKLYEASGPYLKRDDH